MLLFSRAAKAFGGGNIMVTDEMLKAIDGRVKIGKGMDKHINMAMLEGDIHKSPMRVAAFLAQIMHETAGFQFLTELASGEDYEGRTDLGNTQKGDGKRFKGRGLIQITGRANYKAAGDDLDLPLLDQPAMAAVPENAARIAAWYWTVHNLNALADQGKFDAITKAINGGLNGKEQRDKLYNKAKSVLAKAAGLV